MQNHVFNKVSRSPLTKSGKQKIWHRKAKPKEPFSKSMHIRFKQSEYKKICELAEREGCNFSVYVRAAALKRRSKGRDRQLDLLINELNHIGHNLNQITKLAHLGRVTTDKASMVADEVRTLVERLISHDSEDG